MNTSIQVFVKSSSIGRSVGIHWYNANESTGEAQEIATLGKRVIKRQRDGRLVSVEGQINTEKPSLILARYDGDIFLAVYGIDGKQSRSEQMGRRVVDHILWLSHDAGAEKDLRLIAAYALVGLMDPESEFQTLVRNAIDFDPNDNDSFTIDLPQLQQIYTKASEQFGNLQNTDQSFPSQPQDYDQNSLQTLAEQIASCPLPDHETIVIVAERKQTANNDPYLKYQGNIIPSVVSVVPEPYSQVPDRSQDLATQKQVEPSPKAAKKKDTISPALPLVDDSSSTTGTYDSSDGDYMVLEPFTATGDREALKELLRAMKESAEKSLNRINESILKPLQNFLNTSDTDLQGTASIMHYLDFRSSNQKLTSQELNTVHNYIAKKLSILSSQGYFSSRQTSSQNNLNKPQLIIKWLENFMGLQASHQKDIWRFFQALQEQNRSRYTNDLKKWLEDIQADIKRTINQNW